MNTHEFPFIKKKKEEDTLLIFKRFLFEKEKNEIIFATGEEETLIRKATLSATTSPYLRAVMMLGETNTHYYLSIVQSKVEPLLTKEIAGTLIYVSNEEVNKQAFPIPEESLTRFINTKNITKFLTDEFQKYHLTNLSLANVHHDYVRYFGEGDGTLEGVMSFHLLQNGVAEQTKVIRSM